MEKGGAVFFKSVGSLGDLSCGMDGSGGKQSYIGAALFGAADRAAGL